MCPVDSVLGSDAHGVLAAGITAAATSFTIESGYADFPTADFGVSVGGELMTVGSRSGATFSSLTRANPVPHNKWEAVLHVATGAAIATVVEAGPGGSQPITREELGGPGVVIADADSARLGWADGGSPDALLDLTAPTIPTIVEEGVYAFQVSVKASESMTADGYFGVQLKLDGAGFNASAFSDSRLAAGAADTDRLTPETSVSLTWYMPAGARVELWLTNHDGAASRGFHINIAHVQRLS